VLCFVANDSPPLINQNSDAGVTLLSHNAFADFVVAFGHQANQGLEGAVNLRVIPPPNSGLKRSYVTVYLPES